jgi:glycyl-tRNA synthetase beta chain
MSTENFLVELGTEELPPKALRSLIESFNAQVTQSLGLLGIAYGEVVSYATPRRLALSIKNLASKGQDRAVEKRGPIKAAALNSAGEPTPAALGFAKTCGVNFSDLGWVKTEKGEYLNYQGVESGVEIKAVLPGIIQKALENLPIPKTMRWADYSFSFVRPVQWLVMLYGKEVIPAEFFGVKSDRISFGHRIHSAKPITLNSAEDYVSALNQAFVIVSPEARAEKIKIQMEALAKKRGAKIVFDADLLEEVASIVEWPVALICQFEEKFLTVPKEALISAMQGHQKCFALEDNTGKLLPCFIAVANIESQDPLVVVAGNERVMRARLSDAMFFYEKDLKNSLDHLLPRLETVTFQAKLGSLGDKVRRIKALVAKLNFPPEALRAAELSKADLMSEMVYEFPELQGVMGEYYAQHQGESSEVSKALFEQYLPRFSGDILPQTSAGKALALADRLDTLTGIFSIGLKPTGSKDPFGLRRAMIGIIRILIEGKLNFDLWELFKFSLDAHGKLDSSVLDELKTFALDRLKSFWVEENSYPLIWVDAVIGKISQIHKADLYDAEKRLLALRAFSKLPEAESLMAANKRVGNLLKKNLQAVSGQVKIELLSETAEKDLFHKIQRLNPELSQLLVALNYENYLQKLAALRPEVDAFFESVMVMVDDENIRKNRLALLAEMYELFGVIGVLAG